MEAGFSSEAEQEAECGPAPDPLESTSVEVLQLWKPVRVRSSSKVWTRVSRFHTGATREQQIHG